MYKKKKEGGKIAGKWEGEGENIQKRGLRQ
jgi:hypothetical protein